MINTTGGVPENPGILSVLHVFSGRVLMECDFRCRDWTLQDDFHRSRQVSLDFGGFWMLKLWNFVFFLPGKKSMWSDFVSILSYIWIISYHITHIPNPTQFPILCTCFDGDSIRFRMIWTSGQRGSTNHREAPHLRCEDAACDQAEAPRTMVLAGRNMRWVEDTMITYHIIQSCRYISIDVD